jgi:hypothetical protein
MGALLGRSPGGAGERLINYQSHYQRIMAEGIKTMNLRFPDAKHAKLKKKKEQSGAKSWEEWIEKIAGIE